MVNDVEDRNLSASVPPDSQSRVSANSASRRYHPLAGMSPSPTLFPIPPPREERTVRQIDDESSDPPAPEFWSLRRERGDNVKVIEDPEPGCSSAIEKENVFLQHQIQALQVALHSALDELAEQKDHAQKDLANVRNIPEKSRRELCIYEEDATSGKDLEYPHRQAWDSTRRRFEVKVLLAEGLLKTVLIELATSSPSEPGASRADSVRGEMNFNQHTKSKCDGVGSAVRDQEGCTVQSTLHFDRCWNTRAKEPALDKGYCLTTDCTNEQVYR